MTESSVRFRGGRPAEVADPSRRDGIGCVLLDCGLAVATNGKALACQEVDVSGEGLPSVLLLPADEVRKAADAQWVTTEDEHEATVPMLDPRAVLELPELPTGDASAFPKWSASVPADAERQTITLDAERLAQLARALGSTGAVTLHFGAEEEPIIVTTDEVDRFGLLMQAKPQSVPPLAKNTAWREAQARKERP